MLSLHKSATLATLLLISSVISGCVTLNSQELDLHPELQVSRKLDKDTRIDVQAKDIRTNKVIGYRATGEKPLPEIVLKDSVTLLKHTTEHALEDMGIRRLFPGEFKLHIDLVDLNYHVTKVALKQTIDLNMKIKVDLSKGNKRYTGSYSSNKQHIFVGTPTEEDNTKIINELVTENMNLMVNDPQLLDFIQFN